jgi:hypothetical protein
MMGNMERATSEPIVIDCDTCAARCTEACSDCVVTYMCGDGGQVEATHTAVVIDVAEYRALRLLHEGGLVPRLRHQRGA